MHCEIHDQTNLAEAYSRICLRRRNKLALFSFNMFMISWLGCGHARYKLEAMGP